MGNKIDIGGKLVRDLRQPNLTPKQRTFLRQHQLYHEAYAVARQINKSAYVTRQLHVANLLLKRRRSHETKTHRKPRHE